MALGIEVMALDRLYYVKALFQLVGSEPYNGDNWISSYNKDIDKHCQQYYTGSSKNAFSL
jgi:hypothetical protein